MEMVLQETPREVKGRVWVDNQNKQKMIRNETTKRRERKGRRKKELGKEDMHPGSL